MPQPKPPKPTYFLAPPRTPPSGPIRLGSIIPRPSHPDEPISSPKLPVPADPSSPSPHDITTFKERNFTGSYIKKSTISFGIWTSFLQFLTSLSADVDVEFIRGIKQGWEIEEMTTRAFVPSRTWLEGVVESEEVREYLVEGMWRDSIYVITGIMTAKSGKGSRERVHERGVEVSLGVDATPFTGVPVSGGPMVGRSTGSEVMDASEREGEYIFAYRVRKVVVRKKEKGNEVKKSRTLTDGAFFHRDDGNEVNVEEEAELVGGGLGDEGGVEGVVVQQVLEDGEVEECVCVLPVED
ncbi:hypothetical protein CC80DRAFT_47907 [Byssothecium circinans]|uniref:Uncharacterized protein n=1 Tax=Byssothecium circinans TaxID=147558 RepID=A0A6A5U171_9PLEO|nr:hypothetical protein CC80DRAFT_47907 [Byssothecium circinans]